MLLLKGRKSESKNYADYENENYDDKVTDFFKSIAKNYSDFIEINYLTPISNNLCHFQRNVDDYEIRSDTELEHFMEKLKILYLNDNKEKKALKVNEISFTNYSTNEIIKLLSLLKNICKSRISDQQFNFIKNIIFMKNELNSAATKKLYLPILELIMVLKNKKYYIKSDSEVDTYTYISNFNYSIKNKYFKVKRRYVIYFNRLKIDYHKSISI